MIPMLQEIYRLKKWPVLILGVLALLNIALFIAVTYYTSPAVIGAQARWNDLRRKVTGAGQGDRGGVYQRGKADLETLKGRIPPRRDFPRVLGDILEAAAASGVTAGPISYKPQAVKDEHLLAYGITMSAGGSYAALKSFLSDLLKNRELVVIDGLSLTNTDPFEEAVTMSVRLTVYLREGT
jgi:type IV pilus assembly protein PilO